ncbi:uncharacterized protein LOC128235842, partial [Mya arenaria]|uniref:uncharacterized protein LOC128235842 n=1 Tax=Mya arenaria TaxID=6604 RepID=UPI0022E43AB8
TLLNVTKTNSGQYWIQCSNGLFGSTNSIHLSVKGNPIIGPLTTISTCSDCIVFKTEETLEKVYCETDEEYSTINVMFEIGLNHYAANKISRNRVGLDSHEKTANTLHLMNVMCTVFVNHRNMSVKASIYVVVNPNGPPNISANEELLEGETVDITCTSSSARPPPLLKFLVEATEIDTNTNVSTIYEDSTGLYTSVSKLHSFKREWGNKSIFCIEFPEVNGLYHKKISKPVYIHYKYPPSRLIIAVIDQGNLSTTAVRCSALDSNPVCNIKWESKKPKVEIRLSSVLPVPPNTNLALTCFANAYPNGNITWTTLKAPNAPTSDGEFCVNASTCIYEMTTSDVEQEYNCIAKNAHGSDSLSIIVTVQERKNQDAKNRKEDNQTEMAQLQSPTVAESDAVTHTHFDGAEYAVIHKKQRDPENVDLPSNQYMAPYDTKNKCFENAVTGSSVHVEQPIVPLEAGPSKQFDVRECQSREKIKRTDNENDNGVFKQKNICNLDTANAKSPKRSTEELVYADVDIEHLDRFRVGLRACNDDEQTEYSDIVFGASCSVKSNSSNENVYDNNEL